MFAFYSAGQYAAVYPMLSAQARAELPERESVAVHEKCPPQAAGLTYKVGKPVMAGRWRSWPGGVLRDAWPEFGVHPALIAARATGRGRWTASAC
jgi:hypothetical protein